ncbi:MAG: TetR/AcrR family transcriptional regulator [Moraxellaceae bacterium]|jgi:AcrR family transcriptional regulator|nr:TetR/AcrR family transcriptional regulator [Moraxellaceae bacterium]MBP8852566.1 TetR/AcrR family transcriptional regulator [Moraxellaceae bacterium]MBP9046264.1 TetR/AcrR family transcriptional regulator [Moraxellaceae bacterium]MBP9731278.1 TetR/AcrR family transcriptional regulator [Moraxellaceae bacterium]MCC6200374.1 TetR/AcrR family transcriptional regulator [Moraxellaceae bacterium]
MRKRPQQQRSRQMVDTLIEATARTIANHGLDSTTTPLIAETAGVSVGSLYQYFEDKDALIAALLDKLARDVTQLLDRSIPAESTLALEDMVRLSIRVTLNLMHNNEGLYLEIARNWHRLPVNRVADVLEQHIMDIGRRYFLKHLHTYQAPDLQVRLFITYNSVIFTLVRFISQDRALLNEDEVVNGLATMVTGYLQGATVQGETPPAA